MKLSAFEKKFGTNSHRKELLRSLEDFFANLESKYSHYRVLAYGSFISDKEVPSDIDLMISIVSSPNDPGFNKHKQIQDLADGDLDIFTLSLNVSFEDTPELLSAEEMRQKFNSLDKHIEKGITCDSLIELEI